MLPMGLQSMLLGDTAFLCGNNLCAASTARAARSGNQQAGSSPPSAAGPVLPKHRLQHNITWHKGLRRNPAWVLPKGPATPTLGNLGTVAEF